jgi:hypothetical protein
MKKLLSGKSISLILTYFALFIVLACGKNSNTNSQAQAADLAKKQNQATGLLSSKVAFAPESANNAISQAEQKGDFLFMLFYDKKDDSFQQMQKTIQEFSKNSSKKVLTYEALTTDAKDSDISQKYGVNRAPLPLLLIFAPNGAITGGFPQKVTQEQLSSGMAPKLVMSILKTVQAGKIALVLLQNNTTKFNSETAKTADDFSKDQRLAGYVDIINHDPNDSEIKDFLTQCSIKEKIGEAATVLIVPPGKIGGVYSGKVTKETLIAGLASCSGGGCGSACR